MLECNLYWCSFVSSLIKNSAATWRNTLFSFSSYSLLFFTFLSIFLFNIILGTVHGAVVTHLHSSFQRMEIIPAHSADDHLMAKVREGMKSALFQHQLLTHSVKSANIDDQEKCELLKEASEEVNDSVAEGAKFDAYFNIPLSNGSGIKHVPFVVATSGTATATGCSKGELSGDKKNGGVPGMPAKVVRCLLLFLCLPSLCVAVFCIMSTMLFWYIVLFISMVRMCLI